MTWEGRDVMTYVMTSQCMTNVMNAHSTRLYLGRQQCPGVSLLTMMNESHNTLDDLVSGVLVRYTRTRTDKQCQAPISVMWTQQSSFRAIALADDAQDSCL